MFWVGENMRDPKRCLEYLGIIILKTMLILVIAVFLHYLSWETVRRCEYGCMSIARLCLPAFLLVKAPCHYPATSGIGEPSTPKAQEVVVVSLRSTGDCEKDADM